MKPRYVSITPEQVAMLQLAETAAHLEAAETDPLRLLLAAKSLHAAMVAALTAALAGSSGTGAYSPKVRERWLEFFDSERDNVVEVDLPQRVLNSGDLLSRACQPGTIEWLSEPMVCSSTDRELIERLTFIRDELEHPKPILNSFEIRWVAETLPPALSVTKQALNAVAHHLDRPEDIALITESILASILPWRP